MKRWTDIIKNLSVLTQFGLSLITPLIMCLLICWWLCGRFGLGEWIYIIGFFFGLGGSGMVAYKFYLIETKRENKKTRAVKEKKAFNRHS